MSSALAIDPVRRPTPTSAAAAAALPSRPDPAPDLRPAPAAAPRVSRTRLLAASALVAGVGCVLGAQLVLSIGTADGAFRLNALHARSAQLARQQQVRSEQLQALAAPQHLAAAAAALGMVPQDAPAYLQAGSGTVLGTRVPAARTAGIDASAVPDAVLPAG
ncbi:MAG: hypothetical protein QOE37_353 [Microbacteriaceae bacterium]|jgi:hypothetical protein|nr:hypothetical protein [Microbacteriaceae bacterium]